MRNQIHKAGSYTFTQSEILLRKSKKTGIENCQLTQSCKLYCWVHTYSNIPCRCINDDQIGSQRHFPLNRIAKREVIHYHFLIFQDLFLSVANSQKRFKLGEMTTNLEDSASHSARFSHGRVKPPNLSFTIRLLTTKPLTTKPLKIKPLTTGPYKILLTSPMVTWGTWLGVT